MPSTTIVSIVGIYREALHKNPAYVDRVFYIETEKELDDFLTGNKAQCLGVMYEGMMAAGGPNTARGSAEAVCAIIIPVGLEPNKETNKLSHWSTLDGIRQLVVGTVVNGHRGRFVVETKLYEDKAKGVAYYLQRWATPAFVIP